MIRRTCDKCQCFLEDDRRYEVLCFDGDLVKVEADLCPTCKRELLRPLLEAATRLEQEEIHRPGTSNWRTCRQ